MVASFLKVIFDTQMLYDQEVGLTYNERNK